MPKTDNDKSYAIRTNVSEEARRMVKIIKGKLMSADEDDSIDSTIDLMLKNVDVQKCELDICNMKKE